MLNGRRGTERVLTAQLTLAPFRLTSVCPLQPTGPRLSSLPSFRQPGFPEDRVDLHLSIPSRTVLDALVKVTFSECLNWSRYAKGRASMPVIRITMSKGPRRLNKYILMRVRQSGPLVTSDRNTNQARSGKKEGFVVSNPRKDRHFLWTAGDVRGVSIAPRHFSQGSL